MKSLIAFVLSITLTTTILSAPVHATENDAKYMGGTVASLKRNGKGRLDTTSNCALIFADSGKKLEIPYAAIQSFEYSHEVKRHLGVLPVILVGIFRARQRQHVFRIIYRDQNQTVQVAVFEVPKQMAPILQTVLRARGANDTTPAKPCQF